MIPIYTTDGVQTAGAGPVEQAWPVWCENTEIGNGLDELAKSAAQRGAHAIIALRISTYFNSYVTRTKHVLLGTAVILGAPSD
ncbi:hypothetical protein [Actinomadura decatromicini]|uniref:Heavy metal-binding domain-containing protein n=1 Tax=Actinomadura decatromicini TaxID=2604572 RepID=A0A5D3FS19_9ACTN|nr:hypothetical protein [Actinomadura decatromicini]TYK50686.1 hypothetical protein FXF68_09320 [Actinomadura decatromicini]